MEDYNFYETIVSMWQHATGAHTENVRGAFLKAAIDAKVTPLVVAEIAGQLFGLVAENFKMPAMEKPKSVEE